MKRRDFIKSLGMTPWVIKSPLLMAGTKPSVWNRTLVLIELKGGNDGLNTVIPYRDPEYYRLRPNIAVPRDQVIQLDSNTGLHPAFESLLPLWKTNELAIVQGTGYDNPNLSHFRSIDIWNSGSDSDQFVTDGWLARLFEDTDRPGSLVADGIALGRDYGPLAGRNFHAITLLNADQFIRQADRMKPVGGAMVNPALNHLMKVQADIRSSAYNLETKLIDKNRMDEFPQNPFAKQLQLAARILLSDIQIPVIKISLGSFDTHVNQQGQHQRLLKELADGLAVFASALQKSRKWQDVMVMTYSEFGRRVAENGNRGTDHGTAAPQFILGGAIKGGLYGEQPSLHDLDNGNLKYKIDYRSLYNTAGRWFDIRNNPYSSYKPVLSFNV